MIEVSCSEDRGGFVKGRSVRTARFGHIGSSMVGGRAKIFIAASVQYWLPD